MEGGVVYSFLSFYLLGLLYSIIILPSLPPPFLYLWFFTKTWSFVLEHVPHSGIALCGVFNMFPYFFCLLKVCSEIHIARNLTSLTIFKSTFTGH